MVKEIARFRAQPGKADELAAGLVRGLKVVQTAEGCLSARLCRCVEDDQVYIYEIAWETLAHHVDMFRGSPLFALRCEVNGRQFRDFGDNFTDIAVWPGIDFNLTDSFIIRPQAAAHVTNDALNWGLGIGFVFTM